MSLQCPLCFHNNPDDSQICEACGTSLVIEQSSYHLSANVILKSPTNQYRIEKTLGVGGFGITYQATDLRASRHVAIKENWPANAARRNQTVIWPSSLVPQERKTQIQKFLEEGENINRCRHSNIVRVYEWFTANNTAYIVMEFLQGKSLFQLLQEQGRLSQNQVTTYFRQISEALKVIHNNHLLHRDIKPDNIILLDSGDKVVLIDFGNTRNFVADQTQRMTKIVTHGYAPLEQYGEKTKRSPTIDIYALCASMYELLTGQLPPSAPERINVQRDPLVPPHQIVPNLDPLLEQVILTGLQMKVEDRYQTIDDLIDGLQGNPPGLRRARQLVRERKLLQAAQTYQQCLKKVKHGAAAIELALVAIHLDWGEAEAAASLAIQLQPDDGRGYGVLGLVYCRQGKSSQALQYLRKAAQLTSENEFWIQANLAWALGKMAQWQQAAQTAQRALQLQPQSTFVLGLLAWITFNQQQWKLSIRYARQAIASGHATEESLGWIYACLIFALEKALTSADAPDVRRCLEQFIEQVPEQGFPWGYQGWQQARQGRWTEAHASFLQGTQKQVVPAWIAINLGLTQERLGKISEAIQTYETYLQKFPPHPLVLSRLGTLLGDRGQEQQARIYLEEAIRLKITSAGSG